MSDRLRNLRRLRGDEPARDEAEPVRITVRVAADVAEALAVGKVRGLGTMSEQVEELVRAREARKS